MREVLLVRTILTGITPKENAWKTQGDEDKCIAIVLSSDSEK